MSVCSVVLILRVSLGHEETQSVGQLILSSAQVDRIEVKITCFSRINELEQ
ncbi:hypothetical protein [Nitrospira tepida]|uniref:hypothetical protein n=1 Tax=Nitrospira tepida TaxID=2973512 RepID=UPI00259CE05F|nr:hypothetical protein [Nitrospira tepida]